MSDLGEKSGRDERGEDVVWILIDHSSRQAAVEDIGRALQAQGIASQVVTITEVLGSVARDALTGGAERLLRGLRVALQAGTSDEDLVGAFRRARPDALVVTNGRYLRALGLLESLTGIETLQVGLLVNYNLTPDWLRSAVGAFIVPHEDFQRRLVEHGVARERVLVAGPPIRPGFAREVDREQARGELGVAGVTVLVRAEGFDAKHLEKLVFQCSLVDAPARFIFHHNGDQSTASSLRRAAKKYGLPASMFGRVDDLERFVVASDLVLAPVHDPFIPELAVASRPLVLVGADEAYAGQAEFLVEKGAARHVADVLRLGAEIDRTLGPETIGKMANSAATIGSTTSNQAVADAIAVALEHAEAWGEAPASAPAGAPPEEAPGEGSAPASGPFEPIGRSSKRAPSTKSDVSAGSEAPVGPSWEGISGDEARDQLAELILVERDVERRLSEAVREQERWRKRRDLAYEWNEQDLAEEAEAVLREHAAQAASLEQELRDVRRQKAKLKAAVGRGRGVEGQGAGEHRPGVGVSPGVERRFRQLEVDSDLDDLKDRIRRELGE